MAEHINVEKDEYDLVVEKLLAVHQKELEEISSLTKMVTDMVKKDGDYYTPMTSEYVKEVIEMMDAYVMPVIEQKFLLTEQEINTYIDAINNIDTLQ